MPLRQRKGKLWVLIRITNSRALTEHREEDQDQGSVIGKYLLESVQDLEKGI